MNWDEGLSYCFCAAILLLVAAAVVAHHEELWEALYGFYYELAVLGKQQREERAAKSSPAEPPPASSAQLTPNQLAELRLQQDLTELDLCALSAQVAILREMTGSSNFSD